MMDDAFYRAERDYLREPDETPYKCEICDVESMDGSNFAERGGHDYICQDCVETWEYKQCTHCDYYADEGHFVEGKWYCIDCFMDGYAEEEDE